MLIYSVISITTLNTIDLKPQTEDKKISIKPKTV